MLYKKYVPFKVQYDIQERTAKANKFFNNNANNVPLIVEPLPDSKVPAFENGKFAVDR